jgi:60 kDa SS-A/Ro ribonucleoprotein
MEVVMANKTLFASLKSLLPRADARNEAGGHAYQFAPKHALAQLAATGCFNGTFYATAETQLDELRKLIDQVDDNVFLAKLAVYLNADETVPQKIKAALHQAAEIACGNVPELPGPVLIGLDTSGSMGAAVTGHRGRGATSKMRCVDVAALFAAAILRRNPESVVVPFDTAAYEAKVDPQDTILSLAERLAKYGGGGTDCSLPMVQANGKYAKRRFAGVVLVSDNQSWVYAGRAFASGQQGATGVMTEWQKFVANQQRLGNDRPKLVCIDLQAYTTTQAPEREDILNVGGFSDAVFSVVASFLADDSGRFVAEVEQVEL